MGNVNRRLFILLTIASMVGCGKTSSGTKNIFGRDDREWVLSNEHPYSAIGKLGAGCTGTLVGRRLMLTAAHCVFDSALQRPRDLTTFSANLVNGKSAADATLVRAWIGSVQPEQNRSSDWAIVELSQDIGVAQKFLDVQSVSFANSLPYLVNLVGYNADINGGITASVHRGCHVRVESEGRLLHDCDSTGGVSGGPLFSYVANDWRIVGISVSEFRNGQTPPVRRDNWTADYTNIAVPASAFVDAQRQLLATVDQGKAVPVLTGVVVIDFKTIAEANQPAPQPAPQPMTTVMYQASQMDSLAGIWTRLSAVQDCHVLLNQDIAFLRNEAVADGFADVANATDAFQQVVNTQIQAWNLYVQYGSNGLLQNLDPMSLYTPYSQLKVSQVNYNHYLGQQPTWLRSRLEVGVTNMTTHIQSFERLVFIR